MWLCRQICPKTKLQVGSVGFDIDSVSDLNDLHQLLKSTPTSSLELPECRDFLKGYFPKKQVKVNPNMMLGSLLLMGFTIGFAVGKAKYSRHK